LEGVPAAVNASAASPSKFCLVGGRSWLLSDYRANELSVEFAGEGYEGYYVHLARGRHCRSSLAPRVPIAGGDRTDEQPLLNQ